MSNFFRQRRARAGGEHRDQPLLAVRTPQSLQDLFGEKIRFQNKAFLKALGHLKNAQFIILEIKNWVLYEIY